MHIAFAAGTGVLCFVDLVAHLIQAATGANNLRNSVNSEMNKTQTADIDISDIQFHLYVSFPRRSDAVALELFEALDAYCKRTNNSQFSLYVRLSQEKINP